LSIEPRLHELGFLRGTVYHTPFNLDAILAIGACR
jgi:hypothetical protein